MGKWDEDFIVLFFFLDWDGLCGRNLLFLYLLVPRRFGSR